MRERAQPNWWGGRRHILFTIVVFVTLASLDNAALMTIPSMVNPVADALNTSQTAIGILTGMVILVTAMSAVGWGYWGDRSDRKRLLFWGTLVWVVGTGLSSTATTYGQLFLWQFVTAIGLGVIARPRRFGDTKSLITENPTEAMTPRPMAVTNCQRKSCP